MAWLTKRLWTPKPTHEVLGLPPPISGQILATLEALDDYTFAELAGQIHEDAKDVLWRCLGERGVPDGVYELVVGTSANGHRIRRMMDGRSWSLHEFDDFIDLGLNQQGAAETHKS